MSKEHKHFFYDRLGILISGVCLVHCLVSPILLLGFPLITALQSFDLWIHIGLASLMIPVAYRAIFQGYLHHRKMIVPTTAIVGLCLFCSSVAIILFDSHDHAHGEIHIWDNTELLVSSAGSILLSGAHALNIWFCRKPH